MNTTTKLTRRFYVFEILTLVSVLAKPVLCTAESSAPIAATQTPEPHLQSSSPYDFEWQTHLALSLATAGILVLTEAIVKPALQAGMHCRTTADGNACDATRLWWIDRDVVGKQSHAWLKISDVGNVVAIGGAVVGSIVDSYLALTPSPAQDAAKDVLMVAESLVLATLATHTLKFAVRRPRPAMYRPGNYSVESQLSFPSGHTTASAAASAAYATTFALRHPKHGARFVVMGAGLGITALTAYGRTAGGMHFYSDVLAGAIVGGIVGYAWPMLHRKGLHAELLPRMHGNSLAGIQANLTGVW